MKQIMLKPILGFVEGVRYALNIMDMTDTGKNKELLERLLNILEK